MPNESSFNSWLSVAQPMSGKILLWGYQPKCSWPIRFEDSLKCNMSRKKLRDQVDFLFVDKQSFLQVSTIVFGGRCQACSKYQKQQVSYLCNISTKRSGINMIFCKKTSIKAYHS